MNNSETVQAFITALETGDTSMALALLSDDFTYSGKAPYPTDRRAFVTLFNACYMAMPDLRFNPRGLATVGSVVTVTTRITGTHIDVLALPYLGTAPALPTGAKIVLPEERVTFTVKESKIASLCVMPIQGGGFPGIFTQLGVSLAQPVVRF